MPLLFPDSIFLQLHAIRHSVTILDACGDGLTQTPLIPHTILLTTSPNTYLDIVSSLNAQWCSQRNEQGKPRKHPWGVGVRNSGEGHVFVEHTVEVTSETMNGKGFLHGKSKRTKSFVVVRYLTHLRIGMYKL